MAKGIENEAYAGDDELKSSKKNAVAVEDGINQRLKGSIAFQVFCGLCATLGHLSIGTANAYSSLALISLKKPNATDFMPTEQEEAWIGSLLPVGALVGSLVAGYLQHRFGSVGAMKLAAIPFAASWALIGFAWSVWAILVGRVVCGAAIGVLAPSAPTYVCEVAEPRIRGALASFPQLMVTAGILLAYGLGAGLEWDWQARICAVVPMVFFFLLMLLPESPVWLLQQGKRNEAYEALGALRKYNSADAKQIESAIEFELKDIEDNIIRVRQQAESGEMAVIGSNDVDNDAKNSSSFRSKLEAAKMFLHRGVLRPLGICIGLFIIQQLGGSSVVVFYTGKIFKNATDRVNESLATVIIGAVQFLATLAAVFLLDRVGRRPLLLLSASFMGVAMGALGWFYYARDTGDADVSSLAWLPLLSLVVYIVAYSVGIGPVPWIFIAELFPERARKIAGSAAVASNLSLAFLTLFLFTSLQNWLQEFGTFWLFGACCVAGAFFIAAFVPETKGKTLEEIELFFSRPHTHASRGVLNALRRRRKSSAVAFGNSSPAHSSSSTSSNESLPDSTKKRSAAYPSTLPTSYLSHQSKLVSFKFKGDDDGL